MDTNKLTPQPYLCEKEKSLCIAEANVMPCTLHKPCKVNLHYEEVDELSNQLKRGLSALQSAVVPLKLTKDIYHSLPTDSKVLLSSITDKIERMAGHTAIDESKDMLKNNLDTLKTSGLTDVIYSVGGVNTLVNTLSKNERGGTNRGVYSGMRKSLSYHANCQLEVKDGYAELDAHRFTLPKSFYCRDAELHSNLSGHANTQNDYFINPFEYLTAFNLLDDDGYADFVLLKGVFKRVSFIEAYDDELDLETWQNRLPKFCLLTSIIAEYKNVAYLYAVNIQNNEGGQNDSLETFYSEEDTFFPVFAERLRLNSKPLEGFQLNEGLQVILSENTNPDGVSRCFNIINNLNYHSSFTGDHLVYSTLASNSIKDITEYIDSVNTMRRLHFEIIVNPCLEGSRSFKDFFDKLQVRLDNDNVIDLLNTLQYEALETPDYTHNVVQQTVLDKDLKIVYNTTLDGISVGDFQKNYYL